MVDQQGNRLPVSLADQEMRRTKTEADDRYSLKTVRKFKQTKVYAYVGAEKHGRYVYECFRDKYAVTADQI